MKAMRTFSYKVSKKDRVGSLFESVTTALSGVGHREPYVLFRLADRKIRGSSVAQRVLKRFPEFGPFLATPEGDTKPTPWREAALTNDPGSARGLRPPETTAPPPVDVLAAIAKGIPRSYPFYDASFAFVALPILGLCGPEPDGTVPHSVHSNHWAVDSGFSGIYLMSEWSLPRREHHLWAVIVQAAPPSGAAKLPDLPQETADFLQAVGKVRKESVYALFTEEEKGRCERLQAESDVVVKSYRQRMAEILGGLSLPHDLPATEESGIDGFQNYGSLKKALVETLQPRGYRYQAKRSGYGGYVLAKLTALGNEIELTFDTGRITKTVTTIVSLHGLQLQANLCPPVSAKAADVHQYPILSIGQWEQIVENIAVIVDYFGESFVPDVEAIWGPCPRWYHRSG